MYGRIKLRGGVLALHRKIFVDWVCRVLFFATVALTSLALPAAAQDATGLVEGPTSWADYPIQEDDSLRLERLAMAIMTRNEVPLARLERIAHDYVYAESKQGYFDKRLLRRMKADGLTLVETFQDKDGTAAMVVRDDRTGRYTVAFRGTDDQIMENIANVGETFRDKPVGFDQYNGHAAIWDEWARKYSADGKLTVVGHSRGGGLAALFTASHADKIEELAMFQSPGQTLEDHKRFRSMVGEWPKMTLVVAASDIVQLSGQRHIGNPRVIVALANNMGLAAMGGHTSFVIQNPWMTDWKDKPYRAPNDQLLLAEIAYGAYASARIWASPNAAKAQTELDGWIDLYGPGTGIAVPLALGETITLLANAKAGFDILKQEILRQNQAVLANAGKGDLRPPPDLFDHLLPVEFHGFEEEFLAIFEKLIEQDFQKVESGELRISEFRLDDVARRVIRAHSTRTYLAALKNAYEGDMNSLRIATGTAYGLDAMTVSMMWSGPLAKAATRFSGTGAVPDTALRTAIIQQYYLLQKDALIVFSKMMEAGSKLVEAKVEEAAIGIAEIAVSIEQYLLDSAIRQTVNTQAQNPPRPEGSGGKAQEQAAEYVQEIDDNGATGATWHPIARAYEEIHEDLFAGAIRFDQFETQVRGWQGLSKSFWDAVYYWVPASNKEARNRVAAERVKFNAEIAAIDASFASQAANRLAKLNLLLTRFRDADAQDLLTRLQADAARIEARIATISASAPDWFDADGSPKGAGEGFLAGQAPAGVAPAMGWLRETAQLGDAVAQKTLDAFDALSDIIDAAVPKVAREQDYILGVLDFYVLEMQRQQQVIAFSAANDLGLYPSGSVLSSQAYGQWLTPLSDVMDHLLELQAQLDQNGRNAQDFGHMANERATEIAYFAEAFQTLQDEEERLFSEYMAIATGLHHGSSDARKPTQPDWGLGRLYDYAGPLLTFNGQTLCVELYNCDGAFTTEDYLYQIGDRLRIWRLPPGDTRDSQPSSETALGLLWAYIPEHHLLAAQFVTSQQEVQRKVDQITPLHVKYLALVGWRKQLEATFKAQIADKPILKRVMAGTRSYTLWDDVTPVTSRSSYPQGNLPEAYALSLETANAWGELHVDFSYLTGRLDYLQNSFVPKAGKLIGDITDIEARLRADVNWRVAEIRRLTEEIRSNPNMPPLVRAEKLDLGNKYVNFALGTHHAVAALAPFRADFATDAQAAYQALTAIGEPEMPTGQVIGTVGDQYGTALAAIPIRLNKVVSGGVGPSASMQTDAGGGFVISGLATGWWQLQITAPGFQPYSKTIRIAAFAPAEVTAILIRDSDSDTANGNLRIAIEYEPGTENTPVEVLITDLDGNMVAQGLGPHNLAPGQYALNSYAQYMETDPASQQFQIFAGDPMTIKIAVWQDDEEKDDEPTTTPPPDKPDFSDAVIALCAPNPVFIRSLYHTIMERDPEAWEVDAHVQQLEKGYTRSYYVRGFLLGDGYASLAKRGAAFYTDAIQSIYGRAPTSLELSAMPRSRAVQLIDDLLASPEHLALTRSCAPLWREEKPDADIDTDQPDPVVSGDVQQAYQEYIAAYNKLTSLMASGQGDSPAAASAYQAYLQAKTLYEALEAGEGPQAGNTGSTGAGSGTEPDIDNGGRKNNGAGTATAPPPLSGPATDAGLPELVSDSTWRVTADSRASVAWMAPGFSDAHWQNAVADWPGQPTLAANIANMKDTKAKWIWQQGDPEMVRFRRSFTLSNPPATATLRITADNNYSAYINGDFIGTDEGYAVSVWNTAESYEIAPYLRSGENVVAIIANDLGGGSGLLADIRFAASGTGTITPTANLSTNTTPPQHSGLGPTNFTTPARGSKDRSSIMDAARIPVAGDIGQQVIFTGARLRSNGVWAYLEATPLNPDGSALNWNLTNFSEMWQDDMMSDIVMVLLHKSNGTWQVVDHVVGPTDVYWYGWLEQFGLPESMFFSP